MEQAGFIVSIDLGTSKIVGVLARKNEQGVISVLASESLPADSCVKYGVIYNIDETAGKIKKLINLLENKTGKKIGKAFVSVAGKSLRAIEHSETRSLDDTQPITFADMDKMEMQAKLNKPEFFTNYSVLAPEYYIDGVLDDDPIGKMGSTIEGRYRLVVGRPNIKTNLVKTLTDKNQIDIAGFIVGPVATAALVLDEADRQAGCALIDFGAGTTTLSIYKDGLLRYMITIPFGGRTITKDVQALGFAFDSAEIYKIRYGRVGKDKGKPIEGGKPEVDLRELNKVIQLRVDEIILNLISQMKESGYGDQLDAGIIVVGGASQLNGLPEYLAEKSLLPVKRGQAKRVYINNAAELVQNPYYTQSLGLLLFANENCEKKTSASQPISQPVNVAPQPIQNPETTPVATPVAPVVQQGGNEEGGNKDTGTDSGGKKGSKKDRKDGVKQRSIFDIFEKIQNFGGTMFNDEE